MNNILEQYPSLNKIDYKSILKAFKKIYPDGVIDFNKKFGEQGFDVLDCVEFIMELENMLNISISDDISSLICDEDIKPMLILQIIRNNKLDSLLSSLS